MISKERALKLWKLEMADKEYAYDFSGKKIKKSDYLENNRVGWVVAYVRPLECGGQDNDNNTVIMHHETFEERNNQYPKFRIIKDEYEAKYDEKNDFYFSHSCLAGFFVGHYRLCRKRR